MGKTIENDSLLRITSKSGGCFDIHELQIEFQEEETMETIFNEIMKAKETGAFFRREKVFIDTGQIGFMILDERKYLE